ncbi:TRAP transporter small permease subunit [Stappia indica]|uniref:TRAP transporter small permease subunit n=1 Tax=Stappia indica TaxID=538381 RepID=UPI001CD6F154|nr:TRAP transporter small permease [Stappia indica]MCA1299732.1 TRAP transporter small permease [Stappia indica]
MTVEAGEVGAREVGARETGRARPLAGPGLPYRLLELALTGLAWLGGLWLVGLMLLICCDVIGRSFFNAPITGVAEIAAFSVIGIVSLQLPETVLHNRLTRTDLLIEPFGKWLPRGAELLEGLFALAGLLVFAVIFYGSLGFLQKSLASSEFYGVQGVFTFPTWPVRLILVIGTGASIVAFLVRVLVHLRACRTGVRA